MEVIVFIAVFVWFIYSGVFDDWDDSDQSAEKGMTRNDSKMNIKYDYGTGLQYLSSPFGGLTPRLDADGNHMKIPPEELERKPKRPVWRYVFLVLLIVALVFFGIPMING